MQKQTSKIPAVKKGETAKGKTVARPKVKNKNKSTVKPQSATKSTITSNSVAKPNTSHTSNEPSPSKLIVRSTRTVFNSGSCISLEASPNTSSTSIETVSSAASQEVTVIARKNHTNPIQHESDSEISDTITETASEKSDTITEIASEKSKTDSSSALPGKIISQCPQPLSMLENKWTLWYYMPRKGLAWEECQQRVYSFKTVEHFWSMLNHLTKPSELPAIADLALFKKDYRPMWEDTINKNGGRWLITLNRNRQKDVEAVWREALIFLVGEYYKYSDSVCGIVLSHRNYCDKIAIWTANRFEHEIMSIGQSAKRNMLLDFLPEMVFESHVQTQLNASIFGKASTKASYKI